MIEVTVMLSDKAYEEIINRCNQLGIESDEYIAKAILEKLKNDALNDNTNPFE